MLLANVIILSSLFQSLTQIFNRARCVTVRTATLFVTGPWGIFLELDEILSVFACAIRVVPSHCHVHWVLHHTIIEVIVISICFFFLRFHEQKWQEHFKHALTILYIVHVAVELNNSHGILVQPLSVLQNGGPRYVTCHFLLELPVFSSFCLLLPKLLYVFLNFFAEKDFLKADQGSILEW